MNKLPKEKQTQMIMVAVGAIAVVAVLFVFVIMPQNEYVRDRYKKRNDLADQVAKAETYVKNSAKIQEDLEAAQKKLGAIEDTMASGDLYFWLITTMNEFKKAYRVDIPSYSHEELVPVGALPDFPYGGAKYLVRGTAYYHDFGKFLSDFENQFPYFRVQNIELEPAETGPNTTAENREKLAFKIEIVALVKSVPKSNK